MLRIYTIDFQTRRSVMNDKPDNSYLFWLWPAWFIVLSMLLFLRFTALRDAPTNVRLFCFIMYGLFVTGSLFASIMYEDGRLMAYLQKHHPETYNRSIKPIFDRAAFRFLPGGLFWSDPGGDATYESLRNNYRHLYILLILSFMTLPFLCGIFAM